MKRIAKVWLIIAAFLVIVGCTILCSVMIKLKWDFTKLSTVEYETNNYVIDESFKDISISTDTFDIVFLPSENQITSISCYEEENKKHRVEVKDETLVIEKLDTRKWYEYIGINFSSPKITVHLPQNEYGKLFIKSSTGNIEIPKDFIFESIDILGSTGNIKNYASASNDIKIKTNTGSIYTENISAEALEFSVSTGTITGSNIKIVKEAKIKVSTGKTKLTDIECKTLSSSGSTGDIFLSNVVAMEKFFIERSTGDVYFKGCDAAEIYVKTDTGDVSGAFLSDKIFIAETDTGSVKVPNSTTGGKCEISTDTGDIVFATK